MKAADKPPKPAVPSKCKPNASQCLWMCCSPDASQQPLWKAVSQRGWGSRRHPNRSTLPPTPASWKKQLCHRQPQECQHPQRTPSETVSSHSPMPALQQQRTHPWKGQGVHPSHAGKATASFPVPCSLTPSLSAPQGRNRVSQSVWAAATLDLVWPPAPTATETANRDCASLTQVFFASSGRSTPLLGPGGIGRSSPVPAVCCLQCCCDGVGDKPAFWGKLRL